MSKVEEYSFTKIFSIVGLLVGMPISLYLTFSLPNVLDLAGLFGGPFGLYQSIAYKIGRFLIPLLSIVGGMALTGHYIDSYRSEKDRLVVKGEGRSYEKAPASRQGKTESVSDFDHRTRRILIELLYKTKEMSVVFIFFSSIPLLFYTGILSTNSINNFAYAFYMVVIILSVVVLRYVTIPIRRKSIKLLSRIGYKKNPWSLVWFYHFFSFSDQAKVAAMPVILIFPALALSMLQGSDMQYLILSLLLSYLGIIGYYFAWQGEKEIERNPSRNFEYH